MSDEPRRWLDDPETDDALRDALRAGREDLPSEAELASLADRLGPLLSPGGGGGEGGGGGAEGAAGSGAAIATTKAIGALMIAAAAGGGLWMATSDGPRPEERAPAVAEAPEPTPPDTPAPPPIPEGLHVPEDLPAPSPPRPRPAPTVTRPDPSLEPAMLRRAQAALRTDPARALALTGEHRETYRDQGALTQEREVVAIEALVRLGRAPLARDRAARFRARWPRSAHLRRIDVIMQGAGSAP